MVRYLHSEVDTLQRIKMVHNLRSVFNILVGIKLLREGLNIPKVAILRGTPTRGAFLRSETGPDDRAGRANGQRQLLVRQRHHRLHQRAMSQRPSAAAEIQLRWRRRSMASSPTIHHNHRHVSSSSAAATTHRPQSCRRKAARSGRGAAEELERLIESLEGEIADAAKDSSSRVRAAPVLRDEVQDLRKELQAMRQRCRRRVVSRRWGPPRTPLAGPAGVAADVQITCKSNTGPPRWGQ